MKRVSPATSTRLLHRGLTLAGLLCVAATPLTAHAITVSVQGSGGDPGGPVEVQVSLSGGNNLVAGVQADIAWEANCLSATPGDNGGGSCAVGPAVGKQLSTKIRNASTMRALVLSMSDVEPIKQDGVLFTCVFDISAGTTATQCPITLVNVILSDSKGGRLPATSVNGVIQINQPNGSGSAPAGAAPGAANMGGVTGGAATGGIVTGSGITGGAATGGGGGGSALGNAAGTAAGVAAGAAAGAAANALRGGAGNVVQGLPSGQAPAAEGAVGAAPEAASAPATTPAAAATVTAPAKATAAAATPTFSAKTPTAKATAAPGTPTPQGTPGTPKPTPKSDQK